MVREPHVLLKFLYENPRSWPVRMALIEELVRDGEIDQAKAIIRESPDDCPMPSDYPVRIHSLMTRGIAGLSLLPPLPGFIDRPGLDEPTLEPEAKMEANPVVVKASLDNKQESLPHKLSAPDPGQGVRAYTLEEAETIQRTRESPELEKKKDEESAIVFRNKPGHQLEEPVFDYTEPVGELSEDGALILSSNRIQGGAAALMENKTIRRKVGPKPPAPDIDQALAAVKWENYTGKLKLAEGTAPQQIEVKPRAGERISAISFALMIHLIVAVLVSLVVISIPRPLPPVIVLTVPDTADKDDLIVHKLTKPAEIDPSAAARQAVNVISSVEMSNFALPEVENTEMLDVTAMVDGVASAGAGMSLSVKTHLQSDVNFFGISSGGDKIVFVIDATKPMLVDEKGGMFAYNKVKEEIGAMLETLNRGTKFNILVYSGKMVRAFRDELVPGLPSNLRLAMEWLAPLNSDYENLGLPSGFGSTIEVTEHEGLPIAAADVAHYTKCIQKAMEWQAAAIFCISGGYEEMGRSPTPEMIKAMMDDPMPPRRPPQLDPADKQRFENDKAKWDKARATTQEWLQKENDARREKGLSPKVVLDFNELVKEITGETPPRGQARLNVPTDRPNRPAMNLPPITFDDIDIHLRKLVIEHYQKQQKNVPSVHMVIFLGEDEDFKDTDKEHFSRIVRRNNGKMKMLRGLAALADVTKK